MPQHSDMMLRAHYWCLNVTKSKGVDLFCYQLVADGRGDPAV